MATQAVGMVRRRTPVPHLFHPSAAGGGALLALLAACAAAALVATWVERRRRRGRDGARPLARHDRFG
ncbi:MAG: hypothetical protein D6705_07675 [Deltaproteobacteria bacterium]|nr:MAG: hypothetical protein D6705_07675 [Deltaproteobacteria bacterium]